MCKCRDRIEENCNMHVLYSCLFVSKKRNNPLAEYEYVNFDLQDTEIKYSAFLCRILSISFEQITYDKWTQVNYELCL